MKYGYRKVKLAAILICVLAAGVCYSCGRGQEGWESEELPVSNSEEGVFQAGEEEIPEESGNADASGGETADTGISGAADGESEQSGDESSVSVCYVHICGEVISPGVYEMEEGNRIFQVVERAGGFTEQAASQYLNMAQPVCDGMKIVVPAVDSLDMTQRYGVDAGNNENAAQHKAGAGVIVPGINASGDGSGAAKNGASETKVNLNTASKEELMTLKGIGEAKADDIISYRESHGGFRKIEDIMKISGIKNAAFDRIKDMITV